VGVWQWLGGSWLDAARHCGDFEPRHAGHAMIFDFVVIAIHVAYVDVMGLG
jgi:nicotinic acid mononucleotide adenylyltransferase